MLSEDDPRVVAEFNKLEANALSEAEVRQSLTEGSTWPQNHAKHQQAREQLAQKFDIQATGWVQ